jgi:urea transport system permease protein
MTEPEWVAVEPAASPPQGAATRIATLAKVLLPMIGILAFVLALFLPAFIYADSTHRLILFNRCVALAVFALGADLIWGYTGQLSLGQSLFFGLGGYMVAYSLKLKQEAAKYNESGLETIVRSAGEIPPDFMVGYGNVDLGDPSFVPPDALGWIAPLGNIWMAVALALLLPMMVALLFGLFTFRRRLKGVYFSLITQALVLVAFLVVDNQQLFTGGRPGINEIAHLEVNGLTFDRSKNAASKVPDETTEVFGLKLNRHRNMQDLYFLNASILVICFLACLALVWSKFGKVLTAIRDNEPRVLALGYNTAMYKLFAFTLSAGLAGLGGALFVPVVGKMGPTYIDVVSSIEVIVFVAVGGRGTLVGAVLGTFLVHYGTSFIGEIVPDLRPIILGGLFVAVVLFMPRGIIGIFQDLFRRPLRALSVFNYCLGATVLLFGVLLLLRSVLGATEANIWDWMIDLLFAGWGVGAVMVGIAVARRRSRGRLLAVVVSGAGFLLALLCLSERNLGWFGFLIGATLLLHAVYCFAVLLIPAYAKEFSVIPCTSGG